jgi:hypothetical protein
VPGVSESEQPPEGSFEEPAAEEPSASEEPATEEPPSEDPSAEEPSGGEPTDAAGEAALASNVDMSEAAALAQQIAAAHGVGAGAGAETLDVSASDPAEMSGAEVRARCTPKGCDLYHTIDGEVYALTNCGDGTCPTCPPGLGNLVVRAWCAYTGVSSGNAAIMLILLFGAKLGPFRV